jgi:hypothetical protein
MKNVLGCGISDIVGFTDLHPPKLYAFFSWKGKLLFLRNL